MENNFQPRTVFSISLSNKYQGCRFSHSKPEKTKNLKKSHMYFFLESKWKTCSPKQNSKSRKKMQDLEAGN